MVPGSSGSSFGIFEIGGVDLNFENHVADIVLYYCIGV